MSPRNNLLAGPPESVRQVLLEADPFGPEELEQVQDLLMRDQSAEARRALAELAAREGSQRSERDLLALGAASWLLGRHLDAERALSQLPGNGFAEFCLAQTMIALERHDEASRLFEQAAKHGHDPVLSRLCQAGAVRLAGRVDEAEALLRKFAREGATRADYSYQMGAILADRGDTYGAIEYFERAADMDPYHPGAVFRLAAWNDLLGNDSEAIRLYERALSRPPYHLGALLNLGLLYEDTENYAAAAYCFRRVLDAFPTHERALLYLKDIEAAGDMYFDEEAARRQKEMAQLLETPMSDFEMSSRSRNALERAGLETLGDLTRITEQELLANKNFGDASLQEIREAVESRGLRIGQFAVPAAPGIPAYRAAELSPQERATLESPVTDLGLSVRSRKCLTRLGISTIGELLNKTPDELLAVRNFGVTSLNELRGKLSERGLKLRND